MKIISALIIALLMTGCATNKGLVSFDKVDENALRLHQVDKGPIEIAILRDGPTRETVLPILISWFNENNYKVSVIEAMSDAATEDNVFKYRAWWSWDMALYMRKAEMSLVSDGKISGSLQFDALKYGAFGKFGNGEQRLKILLDALFGKIAKEEANQMLGDV